MPTEDLDPPLAERIELTQGRLVILDGLMTCLARPHDLLDVLLAADDPESAVAELRAQFHLEEIPARAALDLQLRRVTARERASIAELRGETERELAALRNQAPPAGPA